jgi:hypothetical protein
MEPVRINYYGVIRLSKKADLWVTAIGWFVGLWLCALAILLDRFPPLSWPWSQPPFVPQVNAWTWIVNHVYWILWFCIVAQIIDISITLRAFSRKEAEQRALVFRSFDDSRPPANEPSRQTPLTAEVCEDRIVREPAPQGAEQRAQIMRDNRNLE